MAKLSKEKTSKFSIIFSLVLLLIISITISLVIDVEFVYATDGDRTFSKSTSQKILAFELPHHFLEQSSSDDGPFNSIYLPIVLSPERSTFHYGVLESAGFVGGSTSFDRSIKLWKSYGFDTALVINAVPDLNVSDQHNFKIIASPLYDLYRQWFFYEYYHSGSQLCSGNITIECARKVISPIVDPLKKHTSVRGYYIFDDATGEYNQRLRLATQVFNERDASNPASPGLLELGIGQYVFENVHPNVFITYDYPVLNSTAVCDFSKGQYRDWVDRTRETMQAKSISVPFWAVLQAHGAASHTLRTPTVEEVRLLNWLALGEDAKGIFWFTWSTDQFWTGIKDNQVLRTEISDLASRVNYLRPYLSKIRKISDKFWVSSAGNSYISTLKDFSNGKLYIIAANHSCSPQKLSLSSLHYAAKIKDLETGELYELDTPISFRGGDGKIFEVINPIHLPNQIIQSTLVLNASFELDLDNNSFPDKWSIATSAAIDKTVSHTGNASLKVTGPTSTVSSQVITLKPNTKYYASWYMKAENLVESRLGFVYVQTAPSQEFLDFVMWDQSGSYDWVKRVGFFTTPSDYVNGKINIGWKVSDGSTFWIDDLTLCEAGKPCSDAYLIEREQ